MGRRVHVAQEDSALLSGWCPTCAGAREDGPRWLAVDHGTTPTTFCSGEPCCATPINDVVVFGWGEVLAVSLRLGASCDTD